MVPLDTQLRWDAGISEAYGWAIEHHVYLGTDEDAVEDATTSSPEYMGTVPEEGPSPPIVLTDLQNPSFETDVLADDTWIEVATKKKIELINIATIRKITARS